MSESDTEKLMDRSLDVVKLKELEEHDLDLWDVVRTQVHNKWMGIEAPAAEEPEPAAGGDDAGDDAGGDEDDD